MTKKEMVLKIQTLKRYADVLAYPAVPVDSAAWTAFHWCLVHIQEEINDLQKEAGRRWLKTHAPRQRKR